MIERFCHFSISTSTNTRRIELMTNDNYELLKQDLSIADFYTLAQYDESCDIIDAAQLIIHIRYLNNTSRTFNKEL